MFKKIFSVIKFLIVLVLISIIGLYFFGFRYMFVLTGSMKPILDINTLVVIKPTPLNELKKGDIITFNVNGNKKVNLTHRITEIDYTNKLIYTKGDNNPSPDSSPTKYEYVVGKVILYTHDIGKILVFFKSTTGMICLGTLLILVFIADKIGARRNNEN